MANEKLLPQGEVVILNGPGKFNFMNSVMDFREVDIFVRLGEVSKKVKVRFTMAGSHPKEKDMWFGNIHILEQDGCAGEIRAYTYDLAKSIGRIRIRGFKYSLLN
jgi:hypothetical protein